MNAQIPSLDVSSIPPWPSNPEDAARWDWLRKVRRILYGRWRDDLMQHLQLQIGSIRREAWKCPDLSANFYRSAWDALARSYDSPPTVTHADPDAQGLIGPGGAIEAAGLWPMQQRTQRDTLGLREMFVRVDAVPTDAGAVLTYRPVFPDLVTVITDSDRPDVPVKLCEARLRELNGKHAWFWDVYDIRPGMESYKICTKDWIDVTAEFTGQPSEAYSGERYPFRYADGRAFLPFGFYHAAKTGRMWDSYSTTEMVEGTLNVGVLYTFLLHIVRNTAWKQRYTVDLEIGGAAWADENDDGNGRRSIVTDPATVTQFYSREDAIGQPQIGQWAETADPQKMIETIGQYERRLAAMAGINPADQMRMSGDPRSGYAIAVSRDAQREVAKRIEPVFQVADEDLIGKSAAMLRIAGGESYPESGYTVTYQGVPLSLDERRAHLDELQTEIDLGLLSVVSAYQRRNPGTTEAEARAALAEIQQQNQRFEGGDTKSDADERAALDWDLEHHTITPAEMVQIRRPGSTTDQALSILVESEVQRRQVEQQIGQRLTQLGLTEAAPESSVELAPTDLAAIITANEARAQEGLGPIADGEATIATFKAKAAAEAQPPATPEQ